MALFDIGLSGLFGGPGVAQGPGLLGQLSLPERQQILFGALGQLGEGLVRGGAPRAMPGGFGTALGAGLGGFNQYLRQAPRQALQDRMAGDELAFNSAWQGLNPQFQGQRTPQQQALLGMIPENQRAAFWALGPQAGRQALGQLLTRENRAPEGYRFVTGPDGQPRLEAIPGGPQDPTQRGRIADAERDPLLRGQPGEQFFNRRQISGDQPPAPQGVARNIMGFESAGNPNAVNPRSSATGLGQFLESTWIGQNGRPGFAIQNAERLGIPAELVQRVQAGDPQARAEFLALRTNPQIAARATELYASQNANQIGAAGIPVTPGAVYGGHFLGADGYIGFARGLAQNPNALAADLADPNWRQRVGSNGSPVWANREMFFRGGDPNQPVTAAQLQQRFEAIGGGPRRNAAGGNVPRGTQPQTATDAVPPAPQPGQQLAQAQPRGPQPVFTVPERPNQEFGTGTEGRVLGFMTNIAPRIIAGQATPEEMRQFETAVTQYTQPRIDPQSGTWQVPQVPSFVAEAMARLRGIQAPQPQSVPPQGQVSPAQGGVVAPQQTPQAAMPPQGAPPAVALPPQAGAPPAPGLREIGPGLFRGPTPPPSDRPGQPTQNQIETSQFNAQNALGRLNEVRRIAFGPDGRLRREFLEIVPQTVNNLNAWRERFGANLPPQQRERLEAFSRFQSATLENINLTLRELSGAAITPQEAERLMQQLPSMDNSPTQFEARLNQSMRSIELALARATIARYRGVDWRGIPLDSVANAMRDRRDQLFTEERRSMRPAAEIERRVRARLAQEFGLGDGQ